LLVGISVAFPEHYARPVCGGAPVGQSDALTRGNTYPRPGGGPRIAWDA
jgi:hypothetical protein